MKLNAFLWLDEDLPLFYRWRYYLKKSEKSQFHKHVYLNEWQKETEYNCKLPAGDPDNDNKIYLVMMIKDKFGAITEYETEIQMIVEEMNADDIVGNVE